MALAFSLKAVVTQSCLVIRDSIPFLLSVGATRKDRSNNNSCINSSFVLILTVVFVAEGSYLL